MLVRLVIVVFKEVVQPYLKNIQLILVSPSLPASLSLPFWGGSLEAVHLQPGTEKSTVSKN